MLSRDLPEVIAELGGGRIALQLHQPRTHRQQCLSLGFAGLRFDRREMLDGAHEPVRA